MKGVFDLASNRTQQLFVGNPLSRELLSNDMEPLCSQSDAGSKIKVTKSLRR